MSFNLNNIKYIKTLPKWQIILIIILSIFLAGLMFGKAHAIEGTPYTENETIWYDGNNAYTFTFKAKINFSVSWEQVGAICQQVPDEGFMPFRFYVPAFNTGDGAKGSQLINKDHFLSFYTNGTCDLTENYTAGNFYTAYFFSEAHEPEKTDNEETLRLYSIRNFEYETSVSSTSEFISVESVGADEYTHTFYLWSIPYNFYTALPEIPETYASTSWADYYAAHTDKWASSTELFSSFASALSPVIDWIGNLGFSLKEMLSASSSAALGNSLGGSIPVMRGYLKTIDDFFGGLPISLVFIFYISTALIIVIFKLIKDFIHLIKP